MAPLPTIGNCVRVDLQWNTIAGVAPHNTLHILTSSDDLEQIALDLGSAWDEAGVSAWGLLGEGYVCTSALLTPLDGTTAGQEHILGTSLEGGGTGGIVPAAAAVLSLRTLQRGPRGRGRLFLGPISEQNITNGLIGTGTVSSVLTAWNTFSDELAGSSSAASLAVASYVHSQASGVTSISMREPIGTMRRRQDQLVN